MQKKEALGKIVERLLKLGIDQAEAEYAAERIWADVVITAVDDEREKWEYIVFRRDSDLVS
ncbi:MAG: hypothetical protein AB7G93_09580 [Bdellovibrionales bacterium]